MRVTLLFSNLNLYALLLALISLCGCGDSARVCVKDAAGSPINGAKVQVIYASFAGPIYLTNNDGEVNVPTKSSFTFYGISISNQGFDEDSYTWPVPSGSLLVVELHKGDGYRLGGKPYDPQMFRIQGDIPLRNDIYIIDHGQAAQQGDAPEPPSAAR